MPLTLRTLLIEQHRAGFDILQTILTLSKIFYGEKGLKANSFCTIVK